MTLSDYLAATRRLLRDRGTLYTDADLIAFINQARRTRDIDTRLCRKVVGFTLLTGQPQYDLNLEIGAGAFLRGDPAVGTLREVVSVYIIPQGQAGGIGIRYPLGRKPYSIVAALISQSWLAYPQMYDVLGQHTVVVAPPPAQDYASEWDVVGFFPPLTAPGHIEPMGDPYNDAVPYLAAAIAKENAQRFDEAAQFEGRYRMNLLRTGIGLRQFSIARPGFDLPRGIR